MNCVGGRDRMKYLHKFYLLDEAQEFNFFNYVERRTCFDQQYPFQMFPNRLLNEITLGDINIFYGGNGSGKSTILNIIAEKLKASRKQPFNKGTLFESYVERCSFEYRSKPDVVKIITSDDVFDYLFDVRSINRGIDKNRDALFEEYLANKYDTENYMGDYEALKKKVDARKMSQSRYVRNRLTNTNIVEQSNGESALRYFETEIKENALYILDEPENSLSADSQIKLVKFICESVRFFHCQFIISTHSPFLLAMEHAKIYDLDATPVVTKKWTELSNVRIYHDFFKQHEEEF